MDWAMGQSASAEDKEQEPGCMLSWGFPLPLSFRARVQAASQHDLEDLHHNQQAWPGLGNGQSCAGLEAQQAQWNTESTLLLKAEIPFSPMIFKSIAPLLILMFSLVQILPCHQLCLLHPQPRKRPPGLHENAGIARWLG